MDTPDTNDTARIREVRRRRDQAAARRMARARDLRRRRGNFFVPGDVMRVTNPASPHYRYAALILRVSGL